MPQKPLSKRHGEIYNKHGIDMLYEAFYQRYIVARSNLTGTKMRTFHRHANSLMPETYTP
jgi:hypothetical protein